LTECGSRRANRGTRDYYLAIFDALRDRRDVLIVDKRGTGPSGPIDCADLQIGSTDSDKTTDTQRRIAAAVWRPSAMSSPATM
jgi:hypothetical protein